MTALEADSLLRLCEVSEVSEGGMRRVAVPGHEPLAVCRMADEFYVIADTCSHGLASLSDGELLEGEVICPFHGGAFDVKTGKATQRPCTIAIATYPVVRQGDTLFIARREKPLPLTK